MKTNKILIIVLVVVVLVGVFFLMKSRKKGDSIGDILKIFKSKLPEVTTERAFIGDTSKATTDKEWLRDALGLGEIYLQSFSDSDATIARAYIENYKRKGIKMMPNDPLYNDVVRIASFSNLFPKP